MKTPMYKFRIIYETIAKKTVSIKLNAKSENDAINLLFRTIPAAENIIDVRQIGEVK